MFRRAGRNFGLTPPQLLAKVIFPAALPQIIIGLRIALGIAWLVVVAAEMIAVDSGLGYLVIDSRNSGKRYDLVVAAMLLIGVIGLSLDLASGGWRDSNPFDGGSAMSLKNKILWLAFGWLVLISAMHGYLNVNWAAVLNDYRPPEKRKITVAYIPVTCQLTCPVTDYISKFSEHRRDLPASHVSGLSRDQGGAYFE